MRSVAMIGIVSAIIFQLMFMVNATPTPVSNQTKIFVINNTSTPIVITEPGYYVLQHDILNSDADVCIEIKASNVTLDGKGHVIQGTFKYNSVGIKVGNYDNITIVNLTVTRWHNGIVLYSSNTKLIKVISKNNNDKGLYYSGKNIFITDSEFKYNSYGIVVPSGNVHSETIVVNTTISNNNEGGFVLGHYGGISTDYYVMGKLIIDNCTIYSNSGNYGSPVWIYSAENITIINSNIRDSVTVNANTGIIDNTYFSRGLRLKYTSNLKIRNAVFDNSTLFLENSNNNLIDNCTFYSNYPPNHMVYPDYGIRIENSYTNTISNCTIHNKRTGIIISNSNGNWIFGNAFYLNEMHIYSDTSINFWNKTIGNFWDDYTGNDTNGDGMGDDPYSINPDNIDYKPLTVYPLSRLGEPNSKPVPVINYTVKYTYPDGRKFIAFDPSESYDPDGDFLWGYKWIIDGEIFSEKIVEKALPVGNHTILLELKDSAGANNTTSLWINISPIITPTPTPTPIPIPNPELTGAKIYFNPITTFVDLNNSTAVPVKVQSPVNLTGIQFTLTFDNSIIRIERVETDLPSQTFCDIDNNSGILSCAVTLNESISGTFNITNIIITAKSKGTSFLFFKKAEVSTEDYESYALRRASYGVITAVKKIGDLNEDGAIDIFDLTKTAWMVIDKIPDEFSADFNRNGRIDVGDLAKLAHYVLGKIQRL